MNYSPRPPLKPGDYVVLLMLVTIIVIITIIQPAYAAENFKPLTRSEPVVRMVLQEASDQPFVAQIAVAAVALDRVKDPRWPDTPKGVVYQSHQFTGMASKLRRYTHQQIQKARLAVWSAKVGIRPCGKGIYWYYSESIRAPSWTKRLSLRCVLGSQAFYADKQPQDVVEIFPIS